MAIAWLIGATPVWASHLRGEIARVGFPGSGSLATGMGGDIYRVGRYVPVVIDLANDDGDQFEGMVEVRQTDADGDEVISAQEVAVRGRRRLFLYVPGGPVNENNFGSGGSSGPLPFSVRVFDRQGRLAQLFDDRNEPVKDLRPPRPVIAAPTGAMLILDMSQRPVSPLDSVKVFKHVQDVIVMRCGPKDLPDSVVGIEMVDVIVWDAADPTVLDPLQNDAIMAWLKRGGHLIVGTGKDWNALSSSKFGPLLPAYLSGVQSSADPAVFRDLLPKRAAEQDNDSTPARSVALTYCPVTATGLANDAFAVLPRFAEGDRQVWLSRRDCGRGQITLASTELLGMLSTILAADPKNETLLRDSLLRLREMPDPNSETGLNTGGLIGRRDVFALVGSETSFQQTSSLYFAFAFAFVIGYIVLVSGGTWGWLWRRGTIRHAWVIFAALAVATSGVSLMAVQLVRALGSGVHEATIVDGKAGDFEATATSYLGFKTSSHTLVDLTVPEQWLDPAASPELRASLRPQLSEFERNNSTFSVPQQYAAAAQIGELRSVPLRATLKQFEATWRGNMSGRLVASLRRAAPSTGELTPTSWVENQLGTPLSECYLFVRSSAGRTNVYAFPTLKEGQRIDFGSVAKAMEAEYRMLHDTTINRVKRRVEEATGEDEKKSGWSLPTLQLLMSESLGRIGISRRQFRDENDHETFRTDSHPPRYVPALLVLTFFGDPALRQVLGAGEDLARSYGEHLEMESCLEAGKALFVGFSEEPGPLRLCRRKPGADVGAWKAIKPSSSLVMYRIAVPVQ